MSAASGRPTGPAGQGSRASRGEASRGAARRAIAYALLLGECVVILIPSIYGSIAPKLFGIPFFYWFQLMWIIVAMVVTGIAYLLLEGRGLIRPGQSAAEKGGSA